MEHLTLLISRLPAGHRARSLAALFIFIVKLFYRSTRALYGANYFEALEYPPASPAAF